VTIVFGLGNVLMGDDGFGPSVIKAFEDAYDAGPDVLVADVGTPGLDLMPWLADVDRVIVVDTVKSNLPPGTMRIFDKADVLRRPPSVRVGPHDPGLSDALSTLELAGRAPRELALVGVEPDRIEMAVQLSPAVRDAVPLAVETIAALLRRFGETPVRRDGPSTAPWWSRAAAPTMPLGPAGFFAIPR
jgi:hydrogenase maturation protease